MGLCQGCHAGCCRSFAVPITGADMLRLERETGKTFWDFGCRWADEAGLISARYAPRFHFQDEPETPFAICLKHEESQNFAGTPRCHFLKEFAPDAEHPLGTAHCGMYQGRPAACRVFPTKFDINSDLPIIYPVPEYGRAEKLPQFKLCSRQWTAADVDPLEVAHELAVARYEMQFFHKLALLWNRNPGPWEIFPDFLREVYAHRITLQPAAELSEPGIERGEEEEEARRHVVKMPQPAPKKRDAA